MGSNPDLRVKRTRSLVLFSISMQDIADKLGFANTNTAKTKKYKCKKKLDELVKAQYSEHDFLD